MVTRRKIQNTIVAGLVIGLLLAAPVFADEVATSFNSSNNVLTLRGLVEKTVSILAPAMSANNITVTAVDNKAIKADGRMAEERFLNLLSNALVHAPSGTEIKVSYDGNRLSVWVANSTIGYDVQREVVDSLGNTFTLETQSGKGTLYAINL